MSKIFKEHCSYDGFFTWTTHGNEGCLRMVGILVYDAKAIRGGTMDISIPVYCGNCGGLVTELNEDVSRQSFSHQCKEKIVHE